MTVVSKVCAEGWLTGSYSDEEKHKIGRRKKAQRDLPLNECVGGLTKEVHGCDRGGSSAYENWAYQ
ncbi:hypothetical protein F4778DRAFT_778425 [Xylariomycetidae sp. FL2044]|nr:hypothetical protein F4778DRAFT_778425 [Xylariomycetidae sp. FL2044]